MKRMVAISFLTLAVIIFAVILLGFVVLVIDFFVSRLGWVFGILWVVALLAFWPTLLWAIGVLEERDETP